MSLLDPGERTSRGIAVQSEVTGRAAAQPASLLQESWRDFIYAEIWSRPGLDRRARFLISMASSAGSNGPRDALDGYVRGALTTGDLTLAELREAALHVAVYAGWDKGGDLDAAITRVEAELGLDPAPWAPIRGEPWDPQTRMEQGFAAFREVMTFDGPRVGNGMPYLQHGILNFVFGEMWCRPGLDQRSRRFLTLVGVADSAAVVPIGSHFHAAMASGNCTPAELHEFVLQYAVHAGWPKASVVQGVVFEMAAKFEKGLPWNG
ncbi:carboxymuconolactone decarboxylase family protein [Novosphingobium aerophilum]|uniref:carboxymuconolactone decarboxylase family protein n=1 Tax=Novosphingobium TaxID=165696 RepID=UPI0006C84004|nr:MULTISPECIES: carboxymuconolactone decarboxylase family protein [unclassified Novosphingobium]KPH58211.1 gamma-carboxymuconolactone decarboxylase [Novosphingobium sp. ST904]MPS68374.1 gamma-carboxymuconolactone decarboxylase [Novosphingobium sp.]TCM41258.1 4-carboxymuconolactone decarboxylase [Novosphingobium sp. ST904]WRT95582.1 carboxymuconolactone decarboxylase family protein [Novosphingobium sp. RL4]